MCVVWCVFVSVCVWIPRQKNTKNNNITLFRGGLLISAAPQHNFYRGRFFNHRSTLSLPLVASFAWTYVLTFVGGLVLGRGPTEKPGTTCTTEQLCCSARQANALLVFSRTGVVSIKITVLVTCTNIRQTYAIRAKLATRKCRGLAFQVPVDVWPHHILFHLCLVCVECAHAFRGDALNAVFHLGAQGRE